ncbi:hypothetical protein [Paraburkholderia phenoliruptrix]|uniref:hypothetical protein n=1 Tax=Paraburkholderia phenoliruptrix TaxID=252970 RepID=UPI000B0F3C68|nr:hypothetical protein [Paraburkholderia phenoliruptrix]MDR6387814.1 hypothetical protein [Paraburkholderia phenoliruptrix]
MIDSPSRNLLAITANHHVGLYRGRAQRENELSRTFRSSEEIASATRARHAFEGCSQGSRGPACISILLMAN